MPTLSTPFELGRARAGVGLPGYEDDFAIAFDGTNYLVVFREWRRSLEQADIAAVRVSPAGVILDPTPIAVCDAGGDQMAPAVTFDGVHFVVAWEDVRVGYGQIFLARVSPSGTVLDPGGVLVRDHAFNPTLASDANGALLAWTEYADGADVFGVRIDPATGTPGPIQTIVSEPGDQDAASLARSANGFFASWLSSDSTSDRIEAIRLGTTGAPIDASPKTVCSAPGSRDAPELASDGTDAYLVWTDRRASPSDPDLYGTVFTSSGTVATPDGTPLAVGMPEDSREELAFDGTDYVVAYQENSNGYGLKVMRIGATGTPLDPSGIDLPGTYLMQEPVLECDPATSCLVAFPGGYNEVDPFFQRVTKSGAVLDASPFTGFTSEAAQFHSAAASDGTNSLVVFDESLGQSDLDVYAVRIDSNGTRLDAQDIPIATGPSAAQGAAVDYAFGNYLVAYFDDVNNGETYLYIRRVSPNGTVLDQPIVVCQLSNIQGSVTISHDGTNWVVAWFAYDNNNSDDVRIARISPTGTVLDPDGVAIGATINIEDSPSLAFNGHEYLLTWETYDYALGRSRIQGALLTPALVPLDASGPIEISGSALDDDTPSVASDGRDFFVVWRSWTNYPGEVHGRRVRAGGALGPLYTLTQGPRGEGYSTIAHDGHVYRVVYETFQNPHDTDLYSLTLTAGGNTIDESFPLSDLEQEERPALFPIAEGREGLVYNANDDDAGVRLARSHGVFITSGAAQNGAFCDAGTQCTSGFCADGVCCDTACGGSDPNDCLGCSEGAGAAVEGTCGAVNAGVICRAAIDSCDLPEACDGIRTTCPADARDQDAGACVPLDGGVGEDGGTTSTPDGGVPPSTQRRFDVGGGCESVPGDGGDGASTLVAFLAAFATLIGLARRRHRGQT